MRILPVKYAWWEQHFCSNIKTSHFPLNTLFLFSLKPQPWTSILIFFIDLVGSFRHFLGPLIHTNLHFSIAAIAPPLEHRPQDKLPLEMAFWRMDGLEVKRFDFRSYYLSIYRKARWPCKHAETLDCDGMCCPAPAHTHGHFPKKRMDMPTQSMSCSNAVVQTIKPSWSFPCAPWNTR